jgi:hypothetical protein
MDRKELGFIFEQTADVATRERWFQEFLGENPALLDEVGYVQIQASQEPIICFSARAIKGFLAWSLQKGYGDPKEIQAKLDLFEDANG